MCYNEEGDHNYFTFFNDFVKKKAMIIGGFIVTFFGGFAMKKVTLAMLSPSPIVVLL
jgi:hypothetical protein